MRVAVVGLGRMGAPMAARVAAAGVELTTHNRTPRPDRVPAGAWTAAAPRDAAAGADVVVTMVADGAALDAVLDAPVSGSIALARAGDLLAMVGGNVRLASVLRAVDG